MKFKIFYKPALIHWLSHNKLLMKINEFFFLHIYRTNKPYGPSPNDFVKNLEDKRLKNLVTDWYKNRGTPILHVNLDENEELAELTQVFLNT